jgi:hypothetical protein
VQVLETEDGRTIAEIFFLSSKPARIRKKSKEIQSITRNKQENEENSLDQIGDSEKCIPHPVPISHTQKF